jgi:hypothetical protein
MPCADTHRNCLFLAGFRALRLRFETTNSILLYMTQMCKRLVGVQSDGPTQLVVLLTAEGKILDNVGCNINGRYGVTKNVRAPNTPGRLRHLG